MDQVAGYIERITFQSSETGFTVAQLKPPRHPDLFCLVGAMPALQPGETVRCWGQWKSHAAYGRQFEVAKYEVEAPSDINGIKKYLGSGLIKGIGRKYAGRIVEAFGADTLDIIDRFPDRLLTIQGIGKKRIDMIKTCWKEQKSIRKLMIFLQSYNVSPTFAQKIFKKYGSQSIEKVKDNPFTLAKDIFGIGFKSADTIAEKLGIEKTSPQRIDAGIEYVLSQLSSEGHVCYPLKLFFSEAETILEVPIALIQERTTMLKQEETIILKKLVHQGELTEFIWNKPLYLAEKGIAHEIRRLLYGRSPLRKINTTKAMEWSQKDNERQSYPLRHCQVQRLGVG